MEGMDGNKIMSGKLMSLHVQGKQGLVAAPLNNLHLPMVDQDYQPFKVGN